MSSLRDLIIIGAGPAGITAAVYAARKKMDFIVVTKDIGGQTAWSGDIENYTGYQFITGPELVSKFEEHMKGYNIPLRESESCLKLDAKDGFFLVKTDKGEYAARTAIVATGKKSRKLGVPGEEEFLNKGLTYCATCDAPLFSGKDVAVIGGGNSALDAVLQLVKIAGRIYLVNIAKELTGDPVMADNAQKNKKVTVMNSAQVTAITGDSTGRFAGGIKVQQGGKEARLDVGGVFVEIGLIPNSDFVQMAAKNENGEIKVNSYNETDVKGLFAAGDVTDVPEKQIIIACGEGAKAAIRAFRFLNQNSPASWY